VFDLPSGGVDLDGHASVCIVTVESFSGLNTIYNIDENSNRFEYVIYDPESTEAQPSTEVSIDCGGYDIFELLDALNTALDEVLVLTYNTITGKVTVSTGTKQISTLYLYLISTRYPILLKKLGFDLTLTSTLKNKETGFSSVLAITASDFETTTLTITSTNLPNLYYPQVLYVGIDQIHAPNRVALAKSNYGTILASFVVQASYGSLIHSSPNTPFQFHIPNLRTNAITLRVFDEDGNPVNWNGGYWFAIVGLQYGVSVPEDASLGRTFRPILKRTRYDPLETIFERNTRHK